MFHLFIYKNQYLSIIGHDECSFSTHGGLAAAVTLLMLYLQWIPRDILRMIHVNVSGWDITKYLTMFVAIALVFDLASFVFWFLFWFPGREKAIIRKLSGNSLTIPVQRNREVVFLSVGGTSNRQQAEEEQDSRDNPSAKDQ